LLVVTVGRWSMMETVETPGAAPARPTASRSPTWYAAAATWRSCLSTAGSPTAPSRGTSSPGWPTAIGSWRSISPEQIVYDQVLDQLEPYVAGNERLVGLGDEQVTRVVCVLLAREGQSCSDLENIVLDENGDLVLWLRG
jgi:hypothetical protein